MSLVNLSYVCSHLQNCSRALTPMTSIQYTKVHLAVVLGLYRHGLLGSVHLGDGRGPDMTPTQIENSNVASRRLWVTMKYKDSVPVLKSGSLVSTPKKTFTLTKPEVHALIHGMSVKHIPPIVPGEVMFLRTDKGVLECREAVAIGRGGQALCRFKS
ncbi:ribosomal protein S8 [Kockiozyma suomiensis]|uniref:ribosomal protein S8 n=1 Tax=Kockiozyma suomiensis TaxID=1337062 RepID=UPI0033436878